MTLWLGSRNAKLCERLKQNHVFVKTVFLFGTRYQLAIRIAFLMIKSACCSSSLPCRASWNGIYDKP